MPTRRDHAALFEAARTAFTNARDEADLQSALAPYGYDTARLDAALATLDAAVAADQTQDREYAEQFAATAALNEAAAALRAAYLRHVKLARVAFQPGSVAYSALGLGGDRADALADLLAQARTFYATISKDADIQAVMDGFMLDAAAVNEALAAVASVEAARAAQAKEIGEAQVATRLRDDAVIQLRGVWSDFRRVAEVALEDQPQMREMLGLLERS